MTIRELLSTYYKGFATKESWDSVIAEDFEFVGGDMTNSTPIVGKQAYAQIIERFARLFLSAKRE